MSQLDSVSSPRPGGQPGGAPTVQKQRLNVYTMMLIMSLIAISIGCTLLYMELTQYGSYPWWNVDEAKAAAGTTFNTIIPQLQQQLFGLPEVGGETLVSLRGPFTLT